MLFIISAIFAIPLYIYILLSNDLFCQAVTLQYYMQLNHSGEAAHIINVNKGQGENVA